MTALMGTFRYSIDHKGRINIPAKLRGTTDLPGGDHYVVVRGFEGCLYVYPHESWRKVEAKLFELKTLSSEKARFFVRTLLSNASDARLDKQGRIAIPQNLLDLAGIQKEVVIRGVLDKLELWDPESLAKYESGKSDSYEDIAGELLI
ncbi:MAG: division/cell wall cluster transcriptional repressor MraZ [candidate division Zixibacteria bacterium]